MQEREGFITHLPVPDHYQRGDTGLVTREVPFGQKELDSGLVAPTHYEPKPSVGQYDFFWSGPIKGDVEIKRTSPYSHFQFLMNSEYAVEIDAAGSSSHEVFPWLVDTTILTQQLLRRKLTGLAASVQMPVERFLTHQAVESIYGRHAADLAFDGYPAMIIVINNPDDLAMSDYRDMLNSKLERLEKSRGVIEISGGAEGLDVPADMTIEKLIAELDAGSKNPDLHNIYGLSQLLYRISAKFNLAIVDGGTASGVMAGVSTAYLYDYSKRSFALELARDRADDMGAQLENASNIAMELPLLLQIAPGNPIVLPNYTDKPYEYGRYAVPPATLTFVIRGRAFGGEQAFFNGTDLGYINFMGVLTGRLTNFAGRSNRVKVLINGGELSVDEWLFGIADDKARNHRETSTLMVLDGTDRTAKWVSMMLRDSSATVDGLARLHTSDKDLQKPVYREKLTRLVNMLKTYPPDMLHVIDIHDPQAPILIEGVISRALSS